VLEGYRYWEYIPSDHFLSNKAVYTASGAPKLADKRRRYGPADGWTDGPTDGRTDPLIEVLRST